MTHGGGGNESPQGCGAQLYTTCVCMKICICIYTAHIYTKMMFLRCTNGEWLPAPFGLYICIYIYI